MTNGVGAMKGGAGGSAMGAWGVWYDKMAAVLNAAKVPTEYGEAQPFYPSLKSDPTFDPYTGEEIALWANSALDADLRNRGLTGANLQIAKALVLSSFANYDLAPSSYEELGISHADVDNFMRQGHGRFVNSKVDDLQRLSAEMPKEVLPQRQFIALLYGLAGTPGWSNDLLDSMINIADQGDGWTVLDPISGRPIYRSNQLTMINDLTTNLTNIVDKLYTAPGSDMAQKTQNFYAGPDNVDPLTGEPLLKDPITYTVGYEEREDQRAQSEAKDKHLVTNTTDVLKEHLAALSQEDLARYGLDTIYLTKAAAPSQEEKNALVLLNDAWERKRIQEGIGPGDVYTAEDVRAVLADFEGEALEILQVGVANKNAARDKKAQEDKDTEEADRIKADGDAKQALLDLTEQDVIDHARKMGYSLGQQSIDIDGKAYNREARRLLDNIKDRVGDLNVVRGDLIPTIENALTHEINIGTGMEPSLRDRIQETQRQIERSKEVITAGVVEAALSDSAFALRAKGAAGLDPGIAAQIELEKGYKPGTLSDATRAGVKSLAELEEFARPESAQQPGPDQSAFLLPAQSGQVPYQFGFPPSDSRGVMAQDPLQFGFLLPPPSEAVRPQDPDQPGYLATYGAGTQPWAGPSEPEVMPSVEPDSETDEKFVTRFAPMSEKDPEYYAKLQALQSGAYSPDTNMFLRFAREAAQGDNALLSALMGRSGDIMRGYMQDEQASRSQYEQDFMRGYTGRFTMPRGEARSMLERDPIAGRQQFESFLQKRLPEELETIKLTMPFEETEEMRPSRRARNLIL